MSNEKIISWRILHETGQWNCKMKQSENLFICFETHLADMNDLLWRDHPERNRKREDEKSFCCPQLANNMLVLLWGETSPWWGWAGLDLVQWKHRTQDCVKLPRRVQYVTSVSPNKWSIWALSAAWITRHCKNRCSSIAERPRQFGIRQKGLWG